MKHALILVFSALMAGILTSAVHAQSPPGWGWVNHLGTFVPNSTEGNGVAGLGRDAAGNLYLLGNYVGTPVLSGTPTTTLGETEVFLAKYNPAGALLWLRTLQSPGFDVATALTVESNGRCTVAGLFGAGPTGGNLVFTGFATPSTLAGPAVFGLPTTPFGYGAIPFVAAIDATGGLLWSDIPSPTYEIVIKSLQRDGVGNCYISANAYPQSVLITNGQSYPPVGSYDAVLIKYNVTGQVIGTRRVGVVGGSAYSGEIQTDNANAVYWLVGHSGTITIDQVTAGVTSTTGANSLVKISANNRVRWIKNDLLRVGNNNVVSQLVGLDVNANALYLSCGSTGGAVSFMGSGSPVAVAANAFTTCVARCDTAGQIQWVKPVSYSTNVSGGLPGPRGAGIRGFAVRGNGFTMATSTVSYNQTTFYGSSRTYGLAEGGMPCVLHFNTTTNLVDWVRTGGTPTLLGQNSRSEIKNVTIDDLDNVFVAGTFQGVARFGSTTLSSATSIEPEIFLAKLDQSIISAARPAAAGQAWSVYPNPAAGTAQLAGLPPQAHVRVYDAQGRLVRTLLPTTSNANAPRTLSGLAPGLYLLQVANTLEPYRSQRLVMQ